MLEDGANEMNALARLALQRAQLQWAELDCHIAWCDERIAAHERRQPDGEEGGHADRHRPRHAPRPWWPRSGDFRQFSNGAQFGAWLGLVPRQNSSGGKNNLGGITKRGDTYLRTLLIQGAKSAVMTAHRRSDPISQWAAALRDDRAGRRRWWRWPTRTRASCGR